MGRRAGRLCGIKEPDSFQYTVLSGTQCNESRRGVSSVSQRLSAEKLEYRHFVVGGLLGVGEANGPESHDRF